MGDEELGDLEQEKTHGCGSGGFSIFLDEGEMISFMDDGDFSSARDMDLFRNIEEGVEKKLKGGGSSLLALSVGEKRISRDFSVLQIAHLLSRRGRKVLVVDCDFLEPGLSGLVENVEEHGFLDLLLYGSSLRSVLRPTGIEGVSVSGAGSFPVSRTIPFALKEFGKVNDFLSKSSDVVIYCSTLYTEEGVINPLVSMVNGLLLCCRIEEMEEGELRKRLKDLGPDAPSADLVCFCRGREGAVVTADAPARTTVEDEGDEDILDLDPGSAIPSAADEGEAAVPAYIERSDEIDTMKKPVKNRISLPRLVLVAAMAMIVVFIVWWQMMDRSIRQKEETGKMTELVKKQQEARDMGARPDSTVDAAAGESVKDTAADVRDAGHGQPDTAAAIGIPGTAGIETGGPLQPAEGSPEEVAAVKDAGTESSSVTHAPEGMYYSVHVASFKNMRRAGVETDYLEKEGYQARVLEVEINGEKWLRVYVGEFDTREAAEQARRELLGIKRIAYAQVVKLKY